MPIDTNAFIIEQLKNLFTEIAEVKRLLQKFGHNVDPETAMAKRESISFMQEQESYETKLSYETVKNIIMSPSFPQAMDMSQVVDPNNENDKLERGEAVIEGFILEDLMGKRFLDFGCGDGYCCLAASRKGASIAVGYDRIPQNSWNKMQFPDKFFCTSDWNKVSEKKPFDVILIYDVLDHVMDGSQAAMLNYCASVLSQQGKIYVRCHPWIGRSGIHQVHDFNKAFIHVILKDDELNQLLPTRKHILNSNKWVNPEKRYEEFFAKARLKVISKNVTRDVVDDIFKSNDSLSERIITNTGSTQFPETSLGINFVDYVLQKA
jgi:2-polyprenyl-3-methyl-5-hydroxy-6-metoxy-1,4-benzoquinol methylase